MTPLRPLLLAFALPILLAPAALAQANGTVTGQPNAPGVRNLIWQPNQPQQGSPMFRAPSTWIMRFRL